MATPQIPFADLLAELSNPDIRVRRTAITKIMRRRKERGQAFQRLTQLLNDPYAPVRKAAVKALGKLGDPRALPYLARMLDDRAFHVRLLAVQSLEASWGAQAVPSLKKACADDVDRVRVAALQALVRLQGAQALPYVQAALLTDQSEMVRLQALDVLVDLQGQQATPYLVTVFVRRDDALCLRALDLLYNLHSTQATPYLLPALSSPSESVRGRAISYLTQLGRVNAQVVPDLLTLAAHPDRDKRVAVFTALARLKDPRSLDAMLQALHDQESSVRVSAIEMLSEVGEQRALPRLLELCADPVTQVRLRVAQSLDRFADARAIEPLLVLLRDADTAVRASAAASLGALGDPRAIPALAACFASAEKLRLRGTAMQALSSLVMRFPAEIAQPEVLTQFLYALGESYVYIREDASKVLAFPACQALLREPLREMFTDFAAPLQIRLAALKVLETSGYDAEPQMLDALLAMLEQENEHVPLRIRAISLLGKHRDKRAVETLLKLLDSSDISLREAASEALGLLGDARALVPLQALQARTSPGYLSMLVTQSIARLTSG